VGEGYQRIGRQCDEIADRIRHLPGSARLAIAISSAQRLMDDQTKEPEDQQSEFVLGWAHALPLIWQALESPAPAVDKALRERLEEYYSGPYFHELGDEALPGADEDAASAAIYAIEAYCHQTAKPAVCAAFRLVGAADRTVESFIADPMSPDTEERRVQAEQKEVDRLNSGLTLLEEQGITIASLEELRRIFEIPLP
jgi:hypothetical protein